MKNRYSLQLFAEGEGGGAAAEGGNATGATGEGTTQTNAQNTMSFDDFLAREGYQAEFDRRVSKAIQTAQKRWQTLTDDRVSEAEKLAQMTGEQKEKYRADKAEKELAELKRQIALGDMAKTARKMLADEQISIPDEMVMHLVTDDAEKTKEIVESFAKSYKAALQAGIKEAFRGNPPKANQGETTVTREQILAVKDTNERRRLIAENPQLFVRR